MNKTEQVVQGIKDQYYWIDEQAGLVLGRKDVVHVLIICIIFAVAFCIFVWYRDKNPGEVV